jgi:endonuclease/exonuclease/phosphatase family metal-dependent hydrolase
MFRQYRLLLLALLAIAAPLSAGPLGHSDRERRTLTVMTRNLYYGADLTPAIGAIASGDPEVIIAAVSEVWGKVKFTDFNARARGLAREIALIQPDLIGLQEASVWRSQTPGDFLEGNFDPNADHVEYDFVALLLQALETRGLHYAKVAEETGLDAEFPGFLSEQDAADGVISDLRLTEHEVILARTDLSLSNPQAANFETNLPISPPFYLLRGWASVDARVGGRSFRFVTTHLEDESEEIRNAQAAEILAGPADTSLPVVLVGDFNSDANVVAPAYASIIGSGFVDAWLQAHPGFPVNTCCNAELLTNRFFPDPADAAGRIDLVFYRGARNFSTLAAVRTGINPFFDKVFNGLKWIWPSDHAGVAASLRLRN